MPGAQASSTTSFVPDFHFTGDLNSLEINGTNKTTELPFTNSEMVISAVILLTFMVVGIVGNLITIMVITSYKNMRNIFTDFILSLCISDLLSATISSLFLYGRTWGFDVWAPLPSVFCRFYWGSDLMTNYVTASHILSFAILRLISCHFPTKFKNIKRKHAKVFIASIWSVSFLVGFIPYFIFNDARMIDRSSTLRNAKWASCSTVLEWLDITIQYEQMSFSLFIYAPTISMVVVSFLLIIAVLRQSKKFPSTSRGRKQRQKERQAVVQVLLIVFSYILGYIPFTAYQHWNVVPRPNTQYYRQFDYWFGVTQYYFLRFSECLNPIFYNLGSNKMRRYTKHYIRNKVCCCTSEKINENYFNRASPDLASIRSSLKIQSLSAAISN